VTENCDPIVPGVLYTRDNTYLRMKSPSGSVRVIEFPNGQRHRFTSGSGVPGGWRLQSIYTASSLRDANGIPTSNYVKFTYTAKTATAGEVWKISDSHLRNHYVRFSVSGHVETVEMTAYAESGGVATATYALLLESRTVGTPCFDSTEDAPDDDTGVFLKSITFPLGEAWAFEYEWPVAECSETSATLTRATLRDHFARV
jgi:hypothetical protein